MTPADLQTPAKTDPPRPTGLSATPVLAGKIARMDPQLLATIRATGKDA